MRRDGNKVGDEILLRSRGSGGIAVSDWLGKGVSAKDNFLGFVDYQYVDRAVHTNSGDEDHRSRGTACGAEDARISGDPRVT